MWQSTALKALKETLELHRTDSQWALKKEEAVLYNRWFTPDTINQSLDAWVEVLDKQADEWLGRYSLPADFCQKTLGIIMAGNIPLVGLHDLICGVMTGFNIRIKASSDDSVLMKFVVEHWFHKLPEWKDKVVFSDDFKGLDAAIATGSNNSGRYFEYYFRNIPHVLRGHRNSLAVIGESTTDQEIQELGKDIFSYFGLGCRNVTHLLLPSGFDVIRIFKAWEPHSDIINHNKYANNYHYHRAILLMNLDKHLDNGFVLLKETETLYSPVGMVGYQFYQSESEIQDYLNAHETEIQVAVGFGQKVNFGEAQSPALWDYADNFDTLDWLLQHYQAASKS